MPQSVSVLLLDDGELDDVQKLLESMRIPYGRVRGSSIVSGMEGPTDLLIATPRRIEAVRDVRDDHPEGSAPVRIVVTSEDSNTLREQLRRTGFDYIVRRPVHPEALRLLILHALYAGEERRTEPRVAMGFEITVKSGLIPRRATLADLSSRGCRILSRHAMELGKRLKIQIPEAVGAAEPVAIRGQVIRMKFDESLGTSGLYSVAVLFEKVSNAARKELEWIIEERSKGPPRLNEGEELGDVNGDGGSELEERGIREIPAANLRSDPRFEPDDLEVPQREIGARSKPLDQEKKPWESEASGERPLIAPRERSEPEVLQGSLDDRRQVHRAAFTAKVPAFGSRALRVLVGRDISIEGMRVEASPDLTIGDRLHLAIYGDPGQEPFLVWATVDRDDGEKGIAIAFDDLHPVVATQLEKLVLSLPAVESLRDVETDAMGTVISEVLSKGER
jgi:CheY-like chemotaxis protein